MDNTSSLANVFGDPESRFAEEGAVSSEMVSETDDPFTGVEASYSVLDKQSQGKPKILFDEEGAPVLVKQPAPIMKINPTIMTRQTTPGAVKAGAGIPSIPTTLPFVKPIQGTIGVPPFNMAQQYDSEIMLFFNSRLREVSPYWTVEKSAIPVANVATVTLDINDFNVDVAFTEALIAMLDVKLGVSMIQSLPDLVVPISIVGTLSGGDPYVLNMTIHYDARKGARITYTPHRLVRDKVHPSMAYLTGAGTLVITASDIPDDSQLVVRIAGSHEQDWLNFITGIKKGRV